MKKVIVLSVTLISVATLIMTGMIFDAYYILKVAVVGHSSDRYAEDKSILMTKIAINPWNLSARLDLARHLRPGETRISMSVLQDGLRYQGTRNIALLTELGNGYMFLERYVEAEEKFRRAVDAQPDNSESRFGLGYALWKQGKIDEAAVQMREACNLSPENSLYTQSLRTLSAPAK